MSFEGYYQVICKNGHASDAQLDFDEIYWSCPSCGDSFAWCNIVDYTNGSYDNNGKRIDGYKKLKIKTPTVFCTCKECGVKHISEVATFEIPKKRK